MFGTTSVDELDRAIADFLAGRIDVHALCERCGRIGTTEAIRRVRELCA
jgi:hypothetical protein